MKKLLSLLLCLILLCTALPASALTHEELLQKASEFIAAEEYSKAHACYDLAIKNDPDKPDAFIAEGNLYLLTGQYSEAYASAESALALDSTLPEGWALKCHIDIANADITSFESDAIYAEICGADLTPYHAEIGAMYASAGNAEKGLAYFSTINTDTLTNSQKQIYEQLLSSIDQNTIQTDTEPTNIHLHNDKLDNAFNNTLRLIETDKWKSGIDINKLEINEECADYLKQNGITGDIISTIKELISNAGTTLYSLSPCGNSAFFASDSDYTICMYEGYYHILYPSSTRGVKDTFGNLSQYTKSISKHLDFLLNNEGIIYSPNGQYAAIYNINSFQNGKFLLDPIIIDLSTGELILTSTESQEAKQAGTSLAAAATFSSDNQSFYYIAYGPFVENHTQLCRYDLITEETEICYETEESAYEPPLYQTSDGNLLILSHTTQKASKPLSIMQFETINNQWTVNHFNTKLKPNYVFPGRLHYSSNSGYAVIIEETAPVCNYTFQIVSLDNKSNDLDQYLCITKGTNELVSLSAEEFQSSIDKAVEPTTDSETSLGKALNAYLPYQEIKNAVMSPDGYYLLVLTGYTQDNNKLRNLLLIRLEDKSIKQVTGIDANSIPVGAMAKYPMIIEWNTDDIIIGTSDGIKTYRFDY